MSWISFDRLLVITDRCGDTNPLIASHCVACGHEFIRSFCSFDVLPLVEFECDPSLDEEEVCKLIAETPPEGSGSGGGAGGRGGRGHDEYGDEGYGGGDEQSGDMFSRQLMTGEVLEKGVPVKIDRRVLQSLEPREVFTLHWNKGKMGAFSPLAPAAGCWLLHTPSDRRR